MALMGCVLTFIVVQVSTFSMSLVMFLCTFGFGVGFCMCLNMVPSMSFVPKWFTKRRGIAVGIGSCGTYRETQRSTTGRLRWESP